MTSLRKKNTKLLLALLGGALGMLLFTFALVPLYTVFCEMTGLNDKGGRVRAEIPTEIDTSRNIRVTFITHVNSSLPWTFEAQEHMITVHPGEVSKMSFQLQNPTDEALSGVFAATATPGIAAQYVKKTDCFSFNKQWFDALENKDLSVVFFIDKDLPKEIQELTLFYSLFDDSEQKNDAV